MFLPAIVSLLIAALLVAVDQGLKVWATAQLMPVGAVTLLPGVVELRYVLNDGMAFSLLSGKQTLLIVVTSIALVVILVLLLGKGLSRPERVAWTLILGGGVGNLIDRALNGQVVDYINVLFMRFAVFNFADICVTVGAALLIVSVLWEMFGEYREKKQTKEHEKTPDGAQDADA